MENDNKRSKTVTTPFGSRGEPNLARLRVVELDQLSLESLAFDDDADTIVGGIIDEGDVVEVCLAKPTAGGIFLAYKELSKEVLHEVIGDCRIRGVWPQLIVRGSDDESLKPFQYEAAIAPGAALTPWAYRQGVHADLDCLRVCMSLKDLEDLQRQYEGSHTCFRVLLADSDSRNFVAFLANPVLEVMGDISIASLHQFKTDSVSQVD